MNEIRYHHFLKQINTSFLVSAPEFTQTITLKLIQTSLIISNQQQEQFSLIFKGPDNPVLAQNTYNLKHEYLGELQLFLVPVARDDFGTQYEVVFNRWL